MTATVFTFRNQYIWLNQNAEIEIEALTGVKVGHSTQQKLVLEQDFQLPQARQSVSEVSVVGAKLTSQGHRTT